MFGSTGRAVGTTVMASGVTLATSGRAASSRSARGVAVTATAFATHSGVGALTSPVASSALSRRRRGACVESACARRRRTTVLSRCARPSAPRPRRSGASRRVTTTREAGRSTRAPGPPPEPPGGRGEPAAGDAAPRHTAARTTPTATDAVARAGRRPARRSPRLPIRHPPPPGRAARARWAPRHPSWVRVPGDAGRRPAAAPTRWRPAAARPAPTS